MREAGASLRKSKGITQRPLRAEHGERREEEEITQRRRVSREPQRRGRARRGCALLDCSESASVRGAGSGRLVFVGAGAVKAWDGDIQQAEVDAELGTMVNQMVHHHAANTSYARHGEDLLTTGEQLPTLEHFLIAHGSERGARLRGFLVEHGKNILAVFSFGRLVRRAVHRSIVELLRIDGHGGPSGQRRDVPGKPADRAGFVVRFPVPFVVGDAFENSAGVLHFLVEFTKHGLADSHGCLSGRRLVLGTSQRGNLRRIKGECQALFWDRHSWLSALPAMPVDFRLRPHRIVPWHTNSQPPTPKTPVISSATTSASATAPSSNVPTRISSPPSTPKPIPSPARPLRPPRRPNCFSRQTFCRRQVADPQRPEEKIRGIQP